MLGVGGRCDAIYLVSLPKIVENFGPLHARQLQKNIRKDFNLAGE